jgi:hypothetical protein
MSTQKRSPDSTFPQSPHVKNTKTESASQLPDTQSVVDMEAISPHLQVFYLALKLQCPVTQDIDSTEKEKEILDFVYHAVRPIYKSCLQDHDIVTLDQFKKNVHRGQIIKMLKAAGSPSDLKDVVFHGICFYFGTNQVVNII